MRVLHSHKRQNPNYPYAKGYPLIEPPDHTARFKPDDIVVPSDWWCNTFGDGVTRCIVINVRRIKYHRHGPYYTQILVLNGTGEARWSHESHFNHLM